MEVGKGGIIMRILIIEDEKKIASFMKRGLKEEGYAADIASDGEEGLFLADTNPYDLIILDLMLPKMDGYKVCGLLKNDARYSKIPIIMFTARVQEEDVRLGKDLGAEEYVTKPFDPKILLSKIKGLIG